MSACLRTDSDRETLAGRGGGYSSWVRLDDAASATVLAVEQHATGLFDIVDDDPAPAAEWLPWLAECAGARGSSTSSPHPYAREERQDVEKRPPAPLTG